MGLTLKALRVNKGLTQKQAADAIGVAVGTLGSWENALSFPDALKIARIEKVYDTTYADIIFLPDNIGLNNIEE
jgi:transcriptional regulator with XRE-family HTH domain